jgi:sulfatase maturation enzyme AslB (radical SAM superfamily)
MEKVILTKKGLFVRKNKGFGLIIYSPYSGLFFSVAEKYSKETISFLNNEKTEIPFSIEKNLSIKKGNTGSFEIQHWLPNKNDFIIENGYPKQPILINWLISDTCNFNCEYCYAMDFMNKRHKRKEIKLIAKQILSYRPLAVVLSGGEPLLCPHLNEALIALGGKTGIIIDTNGTIFKKNLLALMKKHKAFVRISFDSLNPLTNNKLRPLKKNFQNNEEPLKIIFENINSYINNEIPILIQTVVTSFNKNDLLDLYETLKKIGVHGWRLFLAVKPHNETNPYGFKKVMVNGKVKTIDEAILDVKSKMIKFESKNVSKSNFSLQIISTTDVQKDSVILVYPTGEFYTEKFFDVGKHLIDKKNPFKPKNIFNNVDLKGHYERYLGKL